MAVAEPGETVLSRAAANLRNEPVLVLSLTLAVLSMIMVPPSISFVRVGLERILAGRVFMVSLLASQVLSNVPAALLLSRFTLDSGQLLLGVNAGGCGTLIASLASVISFKLFAAYDAGSSWKYLWVFTKVNVLFVLVFVGLRLIQ